MAFYLLLYLQVSCTNRINNGHIIYILCSSSAECHVDCMPLCTQEGIMCVGLFWELIGDLHTHTLAPSP